MSKKKTGLKNSQENIKKILNFDNYEIYYLMDELTVSYRRMFAFVEANNSRTDFWVELERNNLISRLISTKPRAERQVYYDTRVKLLRKAVEEERYEDAESLRKTTNYFRHCFMGELTQESRL